MIVTYPLDLARTRVSADIHSPQRQSIAHFFRKTIKQHGPIGLYRGISVSVVEIAPYVAISLGGYEYGKQYISNGAGSKLVLAWATGLSGSLFCYPMDTLKRKLMLDSSGSIESSVGFALSLYRQYGIRRFYSGCGINAFKSAPAAALTFVLNDFLKDLVSARRR